MSRKRQDPLSKINFTLIDVEPITQAQVKVFDSDKHLLMHGCAGTGKTFISLYLALDHVFKKDYDKVTIIRSAVPTREIGFLPGSEEEKAKVYEIPYAGICKQLFNRGDEPYEQLKAKGLIRFRTTSHIRGDTIEREVIIVDECQNMSLHELDSIITRVGQECLVIFCGDFLQSDLGNKSGIGQFMEILKSMDEFDFIEFGLDDIVRSKLVKSYLIAKHRLQL